MQKSWGLKSKAWGEQVRQITNEVTVEELLGFLSKFPGDSIVTLDSDYPGEIEVQHSHTKLYSTITLNEKV
jgi:hypothetical protein